VNSEAWSAFTKARSRFRKAVETLDLSLPGLGAVQQLLVDSRSGPSFTVETPVVYNKSLDGVGPGDEIKLILVGDNPGRREQSSENRRYLVGPSGRIAENFFRACPELGIDFRKNVIILNKTPVHTPRTAELKELLRLYRQKGSHLKDGDSGENFARVLEASQRTMAELLLEFHRALSKGSKQADAGPVIPVWISGYSEMGKNGVFRTYTETLRTLYAGETGLRDSVFLYRHFSMNQFTADLRRQSAEGENAAESLKRIGAAYRLRVLGW
jgi:hypothetical protein